MPMTREQAIKVAQAKSAADEAQKQLGLILQAPNIEVQRALAFTAMRAIDKLKALAVQS
jgi:hypothetical protein